MNTSYAINLNKTGTANLTNLRVASQQKKHTHKGFIFLVWIAVALGVIAFIEPSPSDIGITILILHGFVWKNLHWTKDLTLPFILLGLFILSNIISFLYAIDFAQSAFFGLVTLFMVSLWLFAVGLFTRFEERGLRIFMSAYTIGGIVTAGLSAVTYFGFLSTSWSQELLYYDRIKGLFKDPNIFGPYLIVAAVYSIHRWQTREGKFIQKLFWAVSCLATTLGILLCFSRAAWANYVITVVIFFWLNAFSNRAKGALRRNVIYFVLAASVVTVAVAYALTVPQVREVVAYRTEMQSYDTERFATQNAALTLGFDNPLGVGPGQSFLFLDYATHSLYLRVFSENGLLGFISLFAFICLTLIRSLMLSQRASNSWQKSMFALTAAAIIGTLINSFTIDSLHWRHFWFLLAIGWMPVWAVNLRAMRNTIKPNFRLIRTPEPKV